MKKIFIFIFVIQSFNLTAQEKTFIKEFTYNASDIDSKFSSRTIATKEIRSLLLNEVGVYVESESILTTSEVGDKFSQDFVENISILSAGITKIIILDETWNGETFWMKASITIDEKSLEESLKQLIADRQKIKELEETKQKLETTVKEIARINKELEDNKSANLEEIAEKYNDEIKELVAIDQLKSGNSKMYEDAGAVVDYSIAIKSDPDYAIAYFNRGLAYANLGNSDDAIADFTTALKLEPNDAIAYRNRAVSHEQKGDFNAAITTLTHQLN
jgi:tetratricopeptide (TPR) repeat protein